MRFFPLDFWGRTIKSHFFIYGKEGGSTSIQNRPNVWYMEQDLHAKMQVFQAGSSYIYVG